MNVALDIKQAKQGVLAAGDLLEIDNLPAEKSRIDSGDRNAIFRCDIPAGIALESNGSLIVEGSVSGSDGNLCRISVEGDAFVDGSVSNTQINAATIHVGGSSAQSQLTARNEIIVCEDLLESRCTVGDYRSHKQRFDELRRILSSASEAQEALERQIKQQERKVSRACKTTRARLDFNVPRTIQHESDRVRVDLSLFGESLGETSDEKFELALNEFFAKGIVGILVKTNSQYVSDNLSREKVFLQLLKNLRDLFLVVGKRDRGQTTLEKAQSELDAIGENLRQRSQRICVGGTARAGSEMRFLLPAVTKKKDGEIEIEERSATLGIGASSGSSQIVTKALSADGRESNKMLGEKELDHAVFTLTEEMIDWSPL